jgi:hypothetical protein
MSGFRMPGFWGLGPRDENDVIARAGFVPRTVPLNKICATGVAVELMYFDSWSQLRRRN